MRKARVAINGFGRIGRSVLRLLFEGEKQFDIVAINDLSTPDNLAYLLRYDSVHGRFSKSVDVKSNSLIVDGNSIAIYAEKDPKNLPWKSLDIDFVIESTGLFTSKEGAQGHIDAGAKSVVISAPGKDGIPIFVMGVNHNLYDPSVDHIVSNASCTTNCLAPLTKVLVDHFGIEEGLMTTVHSMTATQALQDGPSHKDRRGGRAASINIIPSSTGAAKAVAKCLPKVEGKLTGMAFRVPTIDVSAVDLTVRLTKSTTYDKICEVIKSEANHNLKGILEYTEEEVVSSDFIGNKASCIFDKGAGIALNNHFFKLIAWYDNEIGYSSRLIDLILYMASKK